MGTKKILVIDYDQSSLASLQSTLSREGYAIVTAADGQAGWDKYNKESPDLVLMEAMLPKVHGFELCQRITSERNSQATVFIMTGVYKDRVYRTEALRTYGASEYFEKPLKMAELLASIEAVLGRPETRPETRPEARPEARPEPKPAPAMAAAEPALARPVREIKPAPAPVEPKKREKPRSDDDMFSLPADLDRLSRELPKAHKPAPVHRGNSAEARLESLADEMLKKVVFEATTPKAVEPKPAGGNGNGNGNGNGKADIDQFLKTALAGFDLGTEKIRVPKTAPLPAPPAAEKPKPMPAPPATMKPEPAPVQQPRVEKPAAERAKPSPASRPEPAYTAPAAPAMKNTLTPGDPGSDISPFFTPEKPKPAAPAEKPKGQAPVAPPPAYTAAPKPFKPAEKAEKKPAPAPEPVRPEPVQFKEKAREAEAIASTDIFQGIGETKDKKGFPMFAAVGLGVAALAVVGFLFLRPKHATAPVGQSLKAPQTVTQTNVPSQPVEEVPPPVVKPAPVKQKAQPQTKAADPGVEAILPASSPSAAPPLIGNPSGPGTANGPTAGGSNTIQADQPPAKTEETAPPVKTEAEPPQGTTTAAGTVSDPGTSAPVATPIVPPVNEGELVELSAVTEAPKIVKSVEPVYPQAAQRLGVGGSITVNALIDEKGNVIDTAILKGIQDDKGLGRAAENAVKKWKFQPARKNGVAVKVWKSFIIAFKAAANPADKME